MSSVRDAAAAPMMRAFDLADNWVAWKLGDRERRKKILSLYHKLRDKVLVTINESVKELDRKWRQNCLTPGEPETRAELDEVETASTALKEELEYVF